MEKLLFFVLLILPGFVYAESGKEIIEDMVNGIRAHSNVAEYEMTVTRPKWTRTLKMKVWDDRVHNKAFVRILEPSKEANTTFLRIHYNLWNYLPMVEKVLKIPPSMMLQPWMGSDFSNDDLVKESSYIDDYDHNMVGNETMDGFPTVKIELIPHPSAPVVWGKVICWVREKDHQPVQQQFLDEKGSIIKELHYTNFKTMDGVTTPTHWEMKTVKKPGQKTILKLNSIDFDPAPPIPDSVFAEKNLYP